MSELIALSAAAGWSGKTIGGVSLSMVAPEAIISIAPYSGAETAVSQALETATGLRLPKPGETLGDNAARVVWTGRGQAMFFGPHPGEFTDQAAMTDQSDAWTVLCLEGPAARDVLARLTPVDLRSSVFARGQTVRSELGHMMVSLSCTGKETFEIMVMRSMTKTAIHDLETAMANIAARAAL